MMGNAVKGIKNLFGRKQRKARKAQRRLNDTLNDDLAWNNNDGFVDPLTTGRVNPLFEPEKVAPVIRDADVAEQASVGGGSINEVLRLKLHQEMGGSTTGFFKADSEEAQSADVAGAYGIGQTEGNTHMSTRAVASSRLAQALGTDVIAEEQFAEIGGQQGSVSAGVAGVASMMNHYEELSPGMTDERFAESNNKSMYQKRGDEWYTMTAQSMADVDTSNAETQRGMADLQLMDTLTGQADRHEGNIFIDPETGAVRGIDNDLAFGEESTGRGVSTEFLPQQIDARTGQRVLDMSNDEFLESISKQRGDHGELSDLERDQALNRFKIMKAHISALKEEDGLVNEWNDDTHAAAIEGPGRNYLKRHHEAMEEGRSGNNPYLRLH